MTDNEDKGFKVVDRRISFDEDDEDVEEAEVLDSKPTYVEQLEQQLEQAQLQVAEIKTQYKQALDEFENAKARTSKDAAVEIRKGRKMVLAEMLDVLDNLDRAIEAAESDDSEQSLLVGVRLVRDQFIEKLASLGVQRMSSMGGKFDPVIHQAISTIPVDDEDQEDIILGIASEGYMLEDDLLRPAMVAVGKRQN